MRAAASAWSLGWCMGIAVTNLLCRRVERSRACRGCGLWTLWRGGVWMKFCVDGRGLVYLKRE